MKVPSKVALGSDGKTLVVTLPKALSTGSYTLSYHVVSTDTHRVEGSYSFKIK
jgi:methionine-rich copper-binding protein CopC